MTLRFSVASVSTAISCLAERGSFACPFSQNFFHMIAIPAEIFKPLAGNETVTLLHIRLARPPTRMIFCRNKFSFESVAAGATGGHVVRDVWLGSIRFEERAWNQMLFRGLNQRIGARRQIAPAKDTFPSRRLEHLDPTLIGVFLFSINPPFRAVQRSVKFLALFLRGQANESACWD